MISGGYLSLPQPLPEGEEFPDREYLCDKRQVLEKFGENFRIALKSFTSCPAFAGMTLRNFPGMKSHNLKLGGEFVTTGEYFPGKNGIKQNDQFFLSFARRVLRSISRICAARVILPFTLASTLRIYSASIWARGMSNP